MAELSQSGTRQWVRATLASLGEGPGRVMLAIEGWRERSRLRREFDYLRRQGDLDRTLLDSGIAPSDVSRLMRAHPRTRQQLTEMMERLGINRAALPRTVAVAETLRAVEWQCGECADWRTCRAWLASRDASATYRAFCPNAEALDALRCSDATTSGPSVGQPCGLLAQLEAAKSVGGARS
jgi:hypothetical protein